MNKYEDTTDEILRIAKQYVSNGWAQNAWVKYGPDGIQCCANEALYRAFWKHIDVDAQGLERSKLEGSMLKRFRNAIGTHQIERWNDERDRTKDEVLDAFDRALELGGQRE